MRNCKNPLNLAIQLISFLGILLLMVSCSPSDENLSQSEENVDLISIEKPSQSQSTSTSNYHSIEISSHSTTTERWAKQRILVQPKTGITDLQLAQILSAHGGKSSGKIAAINIHIVELPENANEKAIAALLNHHPQLEFAEIDGVINMQQTTTNDPYLSSQWHLSKIGAPNAWDYATGSGVTIAILDGGVDGSHPDLAARMVPGWNFYDNNNNTADIGNGHGTKVAGAAAAIGNNTLGVAGVAWNSKIMPMRICDINGSLTYYSIVANSITWAADHGARVANISYMVSHVATVQSAAQYMQSKGGLVVSSAGNSGLYFADANTSAIVTVAATDGNDLHPSWGTYGPIVDISAPGVGIWTTSLSGGYSAVSGTSFSSPITAGVIALMLSVNPALQPSQVDSILKSTSLDLGSAGYDQIFGFGRVNTESAVITAKNTIVNDTQKPTISITSPQGGAVLRGTVPVNVSATDNIGVARVDLYLAGVLIASNNLSPFGFSLNTLIRADGTYNLLAQAFDATGNMGSSSPVTISIDNVIDTIAPVVTINSPVNGAIVKGNVTISASATDNEGVKNMTIIIDGVVKATSTSGSISMTWNTRKIASGTHTIQINAVDQAGNLGTKTIQVTK